MSSSNVRTIRILVLELLHADLSLYQSASASMRREGRAMLLAIASDLSAWPESKTVVAAVSDVIEGQSEIDSLVTWDICDDVPSFVQKTSSANGHFDVAFCIAPEGKNCLQTTVNLVKQIAERVLCVRDELIQLGSDKLAFHNWCIQRRIPTIPVLPAADLELWPIAEGDELVVKPRFGSGCEGIRRCRWNPETRQLAQTSSTRDVIWQRFVKGQFYSVGVLGQGQGGTPLVLPVVHQYAVWDNQTPQYRGGLVPAVIAIEQQKELTELIDAVVLALNIEDGYVGLDLFFSEDERLPAWRLVELNPRLCTSYLGYRQLFQQNLAEHWWNSDFKLCSASRENPVEFEA